MITFAATITFDVLIATIPHRHEKLCALLAELDRQWQPGLGVRVYRDNLEHGIGVKRQALLESSAADYVAFIDDDDEIVPRYAARILDALAAAPDYVGFPVWVTIDGRPLWAEHSLRHVPADGPVLLRDISHLNPMRRDLALLGRFGGGYGEDGRWADAVRATGRVQSEVWIREGMYHYRNDTSDCGRTVRNPLREADILPLPSYPWLVAL